MIHGNHIPDRLALPEPPEPPRAAAKEIRPQTVGELRAFLAALEDDCPMRGLNYGAFRYVLDAQGNGQVQYV